MNQYNKSKLKISVITLVHNCERYLTHAILSVVNQSHQNVEYIVIDGGSKDRSLEIIRKNRKNITKWLSEPDEGIYDALNKGIKHATGNVIGLLHADDIFAGETVIERIAKVFENDNADLVYSDLEYIAKNGKTFRKWKAGAYKTLRYGWMPPHPTLFVKKELFERYGLYRLNYKISSDYDMVLRLFKQKELKISYLPEVTVKMRTGGASNKSLGNIFQKSKEDYLALKNNGMSIPLFTLLCKNLRKIGQFF